MNATDEVVGDVATSSDTTEAALFDAGTTTYLGALPGDPDSAALAINRNGFIVGYSGSSELPFGSASPVAFENGAVVDLDPGQDGAAFGVNGSGDVVGYTVENGVNHAVSFAGGTATPIDNNSSGIVNTIALAVNKAGVAVGWGFTAPGPFHAMMFEYGHAIDLEPNEAGDGQASAINRKDWVVGQIDLPSGVYHAALFKNGAVIDLNTRLPSTTQWTLLSANGINNKDQIVGTAYSSEPGVGYHAFILSP